MSRATQPDQMSDVISPTVLSCLSLLSFQLLPALLPCPSLAGFLVLEPEAVARKVLLACTTRKPYPWPVQTVELEMLGPVVALLESFAAARACVGAFLGCTAIGRASIDWNLCVVTGLAVAMCHTQFDARATGPAALIGS